MAVPIPDNTTGESSISSADAATLALLGKKQVLKRRFGFLALFGFAVCELITWETVLALFSQPLDNGGPAGAIYGFIIAWLSTISVYMVISELASIAPIAGGQYYWVYMLAPLQYKVFFSYMTGWLASLAWIATVATETIFTGTMIQALIILGHPDYADETYQVTLFAWLVTAVAIFINVLVPNWLPRFEVFILVFHLAGFISILITLLVMTPNFSPNASVWLSGLNGGGWSTQGLSYCVGFLGNVAIFVGADASVHMAEEVSNAALNIPRAILGAMLINGIVGFAMMITVVYCLGNITTVLSTKTGFPFIQIFTDSVGNVAGATVMGAVVLALTWACAIGITTTASRMTWSFARDRGVPFSRFISRVNPKTQIPIIAVLVVTGFACLLTLIYIGSDKAFNDVVSLTITGFYGSYLLPAVLLLYHRIIGNIQPHGTANNTALLEEGAGKTTDEKTPVRNIELAEAQAGLVWGPWRVPGWLGILNNVYACLYMVFVIFWSVWPPATPVTASTMNYSIVVTGGVIMLSIVWYFVRGRKEYRGPLIDEEVAAILRMIPV